MRTTITVDVVKGAEPLGWPRLENNDYVMSTGSIRPLEDAFRIGQKDLLGWVSGLLHLDVMDAYQLASQLGVSPVANVCDPNYTFVAKFPKRHLDGSAYDGAHNRLSGIADEYRKSFSLRSRPFRVAGRVGRAWRSRSVNLLPDNDFRRNLDKGEKHHRDVWLLPNQLAAWRFRKARIHQHTARIFP